MEFDVALKELAELAKANNNTVYSNDVLKYCKEDDEYEKIVELLNEKSVDVVPSASNAEDEEEADEPVNLGEVEEVDISTYDQLPPSIKVDDPVRMYLKDIGMIPLLTIDEETRYAQYVVEGRAAKEKLAKLDEADENTVSVDEYRDLEAIVERANMAKDKLVNANLRLVVSIAKRYLSRGLQFLDLIQEGNMGLIKAVDKFDYTRGYKFSTYATWWIRQAITRAVADQARTIRIPVHMVETINRLVKYQRQLVQELSREPSPEELAVAMEMSVEKVQQIQRIAQEPISLENPVGEEEDSSLGDFISDENALDPYEYTAKLMLREELDKALNELTDRESRVLKLRFGLIDGRPRTLEEVGKEFDVTRERIRQIEAKALRKLKRKNSKLQDFMNTK